MSCTWEDKILLHLDAGLTASEDLQVRRHLASCSSCARIYEDLQAMDDALSTGVQASLSGLTVVSSVSAALKGQLPDEVKLSAKGIPVTPGVKTALLLAPLLLATVVLLIWPPFSTVRPGRPRTAIRLRAISGTITPQGEKSSAGDATLSSNCRLEISGVTAVHYGAGVRPALLIRGEVEVSTKMAALRWLGGSGDVTVPGKERIPLVIGEKLHLLAPGTYRVHETSEGEIVLDILSLRALPGKGALLSDRGSVLPVSPAAISPVIPPPGSRTNLGETNPFTERKVIIGASAKEEIE